MLAVCVCVANVKRGRDVVGEPWTVRRVCCPVPRAVDGPTRGSFSEVAGDTAALHAALNCLLKLISPVITLELDLPSVPTLSTWLIHAHATRTGTIQSIPVPVPDPVQYDTGTTGPGTRRCGVRRRAGPPTMSTYTRAAIAVGACAVLALLRRKSLLVFAFGRAAAAAEAAKHFYPVGTAGLPWTAVERAAWLTHAGVVQRSYEEEVLRKITPLRKKFVVTTYGALAQDPDRYPLFCVKTTDWDASKPSVLITGGIHGYETSGVQGALLFLQTAAQQYSDRFNIAVCPCVCPWGYECVQRWTAVAEDPNRHFVAGDTIEETALLMELVASLGVTEWAMHLDLHETTDSDLEEFRPAKASRDGLPLPSETIPDGFYLIGTTDAADATTPQRQWLGAIVDGVREVTHIAPPDANGEVVGERLVQDGIILTPHAGRSRCITNAKFRATTEVYPDSAGVTAEQCNRAQLAAVTAGLDFIAAHQGL